MNRLYLLFAIIFLSSSWSEAKVPFGKLAFPFINTPYVASTLEQCGDEKLIINTKEVDCTTFVEYLTASVLLDQPAKGSDTMFRNQVQALRYRNGIIDGYLSRLHYFSEWIEDNEKKGLIREITDSIGGIPFVKTIEFMSAHADLYQALKQQPELVDSIRVTEQHLSRLQTTFIPKEEVRKTESKIRKGDIIAITTSIKGLDVVHVGFAWPQNGRLHLLHASSTAKKVLIDPLPLAEYLEKNRTATGIRVLRIRE
ncbi:MAG: DUF1460 domain-containing protein [Bacteroidales bacterium]